MNRYILMVLVLLGCTDRGDEYINQDKGENLNAIIENEMARDTSINEIFMGVQLGWTMTKMMEYLDGKVEQGELGMEGLNYQYDLKTATGKYECDFIMGAYADTLYEFTIDLKTASEVPDLREYHDLKNLYKEKYGQPDYTYIDYDGIEARAYWIDANRQIQIHYTSVFSYIKYIDSKIEDRKHRIGEPQPSETIDDI